MAKRSDTTWTVFHYLMAKGEPQTRNQIAKDTGLPTHYVNNVIQHNQDLFVKAGQVAGRRGFLWAAWEE